MQCDKTNSHMVTAGRSCFCTLRNACVSAGKPPWLWGKIYHGCFEMLSWPHRISNNIINTYFWLLETCMKCSYFIEENMRPRAQPLAFEVWVYCAPVHKYIVGRQSAFVQVSRQLTLDVLRRLLLLHHSYTMMPMYSSQQRSLSRK